MNKRSRDLLWCSLLAIAIVVFRSFPFLAYEQLDFDSDQAIVGLMAKHLSELRTFPLFFYGQHYMLGVQAWIAAPFIWLGGPTVAMLRLPLVIVNGVVALWLLRTLTRSIGSPWLALAAVLPLVASAPVLSANLLETLGASVEPFLYVLALWALRGRPVAFGLVLAVGFLHREFTILAVGGVAVASYVEHGRTPLGNARWVTRAVLAFGAVWFAIDQLKRRINTLGPPGGASTTAPLTLQFETLMARASLAPSLVVPRLKQLATDVVPDLFGMRTIQPLRYNINATVPVGSHVTGGMLIAAGLICLVCIAVQVRRSSRAGERLPLSPFCVFLAVVGVQGLLAYSLSDAVDPRFPAILRYALLGLLLPLAFAAAFFEIERRRILRAGVAFLLVGAAALNIRDTWRIIGEYRRTPPANEHRVLADDLTAHGIQYGWAIYQDAYITDFFAGERVMLTSTGKVRIAAYEEGAARHAASAVRAVRQPCGQGRRVASWCIVDPLNR
jgi:hypothetical protein